MAATVLHLIKNGDTRLARAVIDQNLGAGDRVTVALLPGAAAPALPAGVAVHRVPDDFSYERLLELIFEADQVIAW